MLLPFSWPLSNNTRFVQLIRHKFSSTEFFFLTVENTNYSCTCCINTSLQQKDEGMLWHLVIYVQLIGPMWPADPVHVSWPLTSALSLSCVFSLRRRKNKTLPIRLFFCFLPHSYFKTWPPNKEFTKMFSMHLFLMFRSSWGDTDFIFLIVITQTAARQHTYSKSQRYNM